MSEFDSIHERQMDAQLRRLGDASRAERAGCPPPDLLFARRSEALDAEVRDRLEVHVAACPACRRLAADVDELDLAAPDTAVEARVLARLPGPPRRRHAGLLSLAAALVLVSGLTVIWWSRRSNPPPSPGPVASRTEPATRPAAAVVALWTIAPAPIRVPLSSLGATRSGEGSASDGIALVGALAPYQSGDYAAATARLTEVVKDFPASGEARFYLGVSELLAGLPEPALASLEQAGRLLPAARQVEVDWYRATAEQRTGRIEPARTRLQAVCALTGPYQAQACAAEAALK